MLNIVVIINWLHIKMTALIIQDFFLFEFGSWTSLNLNLLQLLLCYLSPSRDVWEKELTENRQKYAKLKEELLLSPVSVQLLCPLCILTYFFNLVADEFVILVIRLFFLWLLVSMY